MPGAVAMENGAPNGARTDHDRNQVNGAGSYGMVDAPAGSSKALPQESGESGTMMNGGEVQNPVGTDENAMTVANLDRMNDLPDEIQHITDGFVSISNLLRRLSQHTHNVLEATLEQLARMPLPSSAGAMVNGNSGTSARSGDEYDVSGESVQKKVAFLNFLQMHRGKWIKALVITNWSRNSTDVSKLIDLRDYLWRQTMEYNQRLDELAELKRNLHFARVPSPDLKTAYQVLSSGKADWMPDVSPFSFLLSVSD
jgi:mediator of RNA polymerase II transcription subunit 14